MTAKSKLGNKRIYIEDDLTQEERIIQYQLRKIAREKKREKIPVTIGYQKIVINGKVYKWDKEQNKITEITHRQKN